MQQFAGTSLKTRLYFIVLAAYIPVAVLILFIAEEQKGIETQAILDKTLMLARAAANEENRQMESMRILLSAISKVYLLADGRADRMSGVMAALQTQAPDYACFGILDLKGHLLAGSDSALDRDYSQRAWFVASLQGQAPAIGRYQGEQIHGQAVLYVAVPILNGRQVIAVSFAALKLNGMNRTVSRRLSELPRHSRVYLLDEVQGMLRYDVDAARWSAPTDFDADLRRKIVSGQSGTLIATAENAGACIYAFAPLASSLRDRKAFVVLAIPRALALRAANRLFARNLVLLILSAFIAVLCIWWAGDVLILRRVRVMVAATRKLAAGDPGARIGAIGVQDELSHLAGVFDEMAASLQQRLEREAQVLNYLQQSQEQLRRLSAHQQAVREQERIRIARELHDQFGQALTILKMDLSWLDKQIPRDMPRAHQKMGAMSAVIDATLKNLHAVTAELRPVVLDDFGLAAAIEWQLEEFSERSGMECRFENNGFEPDLHKDLATALYRIFQEAITNIMRHAQADRVVVRLEERDGELMLQIRDNGRGISEDEINDPKAFGLLGMRERLYPWNGRVSIEGRPGQGTRVTIRLAVLTKGELQ